MLASTHWKIYYLNICNEIKCIHLLIYLNSDILHKILWEMQNKNIQYFSALQQGCKILHQKFYHLI